MNEIRGQCSGMQCWPKGQALVRIQRLTNALSRAGRIRLGRDALWVVGWALYLCALEFSAPDEASELGDLLRLISLGFCALLTAMVHNNRPIAWCTYVVTWLVGLTNSLRKVFFEVGVDLRETPPIQRRTPTRLLFFPLALVILAAVLNSFPESVPYVFQELTAPHPYLVHLFGLAILWIVLAFVSLITAFIVLAVVHDGLVLRHTSQEDRSTWPEIVIVLSTIGLIAIAGFLLPVWIGTCLIVGAILTDIVVLALPKGPRLTLLWQEGPEQEGGIRSLDWRVLVMSFYASIGMSLVVLLYISCGQDVNPWGEVTVMRDSMPVTRFLGVGMAWCSAAGLCFYSFRHIRMVFTARNDNPSEPRPAVVGVRGILSPETKRRLRSELALRDWLPKFEGEKNDSKCGVEIDVIEDDALVDGQTLFAWPPCVTASQLLGNKALATLRRSHDLKCRRNLVRGLERVFKKSARRNFEFGTGFYVAPHLWWVPALQRDDDEEEADLEEGALLDEYVGPYYNRVMSLAARHHFYGIMRDLQLDIIFVEDGVDYRRFRRVLRRLFELFDANDGHQQAEDHHFGCAQGTRVLIHEHSLENPFESDTYPEPSYSGLGRARILHVYRDRGGDEEDSPVDSIPEREFEPVWS